MLPQDFRVWLHREPFRPFRLYVLEVTSYEIRHPELALLTTGAVKLVFSEGDNPFPLTERLVAIDLMAISRLETLPPKPADSANGA